MRHIYESLKRRRHPTLLGNDIHNYGNVFMIPWNFKLLGSQKFIEHRKQLNILLQPYCLLQNSFSTAFTSVHGERPSAEYAKLRKESLESEFGEALGSSSKRVSIFYRFGPFLALYRAAIISFHMLRLTISHVFVQDMKKRAIKVYYSLLLFTLFQLLHLTSQSLSFDSHDYSKSTCFLFSWNMTNHHHVLSRLGKKAAT